MNTNPREYQLDYIKGILIYLVVLGHCLYWTNETIPLRTYIAEYIYSFHMPFFILLSGYFFSKNKTLQFHKLISKQAKRLLYPHFFFNLIMLVPIFLFWQIFNYYITKEGMGHITFKSIYNYLTMFWYLWCVFFCSIIVNIIFLKTKKATKWMFLTAVALFICQYITPTKVFFIHQQMSDQFIFFAIGIWLYDNKNQLKQKRIYSVIAFIIYFVCLYLNFKKVVNSNAIFHCLMAMSGIIFHYYLWESIYKRKFFYKQFLLVSQYTLGIYIYHFPILKLLIETKIYSKMLNIFSFPPILIDLVVAGFIVIVTACLIILMKKSTYLKQYALGESAYCKLRQ